MSADNYLHIAQEGKEYILYYGCASNDHRTEKGRFDTIEAAIKASQAYESEYGLSFDLLDVV